MQKHEHRQQGITLHVYVYVYRDVGAYGYYVCVGVKTLDEM